MSSPHSTPSALHRLTAVAAALLVLALTILVARPDLHARLHASAPDAAHQEQGCAVSLFASGVAPLLDTAVLAAVPLVRPTDPAPVVRELFVCAPRFLRLPGRGPPGC